jgi:class 3 adenylate cyclase
MIADVAEPGGAWCPRCGAAAGPEQRFCGRCGARLGHVCPVCGADNPTDHRFCGACGARLGEAAPAVEPAAGSAQPEERRWVTILFADVAGFTALAERLDPEDAKELAARCAERLSEEVRRFGGTVLDVMGDGVLAAFGAPLSHEDDAERAVRAALAMRDCRLVSRTGAELQVHVGVNTGEAMAGPIGPAEHRQYAVIGDTTNTAHRLTVAARPGSVLVGEETYRATRKAVRYRQVAPVAAKGKERPVPAWEALGVAPVAPGRRLGTAPLVGRDAELELLAGIWAKVRREARPHLVTVIGEPGIGKSRLVTEFERRALGEATVLHGRCLPYGEALGYGALATALKEAAAIEAEDDAAAARAKLGRLVASAVGSEPGEGDPAEVGRHLALLSGLDLAADRSGPVPEQRGLHGSVRRFLEALARQRPLCLLIEDIHWADGALLELIESVVARAHEAPLMTIAQARPELLERRAGWGRGVRAFTSLSLEPLDERAAQALLLALCRERGLGEDAVAEVGAAAGGNPLFAEELVATVAERGQVSGIPSVIKTLISARLDTLPWEERRTLQLAGVFGKLCWEGGLRALGAPGDVAESLEGLARKDLLRPQARAQFRGQREYAFKHDLIRDVAYEALPRAERRALHGRVVDWIEAVGGERLEQSLDVLAHHAVQAAQRERGIDYLSRAAERARRAAAHPEEAALLGQAVELAGLTGPASLVAELRAQRGAALARLGAWPDARADLEAALAALAPEQAERRAEVLAELSTVCFWALDAAGMRRYAAEAQAAAEPLGRDDLTAAATAWLAEAEKIDGDLPTARDLYRRAIARAGGLRVAPLANAALTFYLLGQIDDAVAVARESLRAARGVNDTLFTMYALSHLGLGLGASGRYEEAARTFDEARRFGREHEVGHFVARAVGMSVGFHVDVFDLDGAEALAEEARELARSASFPPTLVSAGVDLLLIFARRGEVGRAERLVDEVAEMAARVAGWHGWLWRLRLAQARAEVALARGDLAAARRWVDESIEQSRARGRVKYQAIGLATRAGVLAAGGRTKAARADLQRAVALARPVGDPALFLRAAAALLAIDGDDALLDEVRRSARRVESALPDDAMRRRFEAAEPLRRLARLAR